MLNASQLDRIFRNVKTSQLEVSDEGRKLLVQECRWQFLLFQGTFQSTFLVHEDPATRSLAFSAESAFMRQFVGRWEVREGAAGGSHIYHSLSVQPQLSPPQRVGDLSKQIFTRQVESILFDLATELTKIAT